MKRMGWAAVLAAAGLGLSCAGEREQPSCSSLRPAQPEGVYGCVGCSNDIGTPAYVPLSSFPVQAFASEPPPTPDDGLAPVLETRSDAAGFYALTLPAGRYWLCTSFRRCAAVDVPAHASVAMNYECGESPGWWAP